MVAVLEQRPVIGCQVPAVRSVPAYVESRGREAIEVAASVGLVLDEWQQLVLVDACGVREDGRWAAFEAGVEVARQNGKGGILEARELAGLLAWGEHRLLHSAHEFQTSMEAMLRMEEYLASSPDIARQVKSVSRSHGSEGFVLKTGQRLRYRTRTKGGGRGFTGDFLAFDEAMVLQESFIGALLPTLSGRSIEGNPQVWYAGSAVDQQVHEHGLVFARLRQRGLTGNDPSLAYFGWSAAPVLDEDDEPMTPDRLDLDVLSDPEAWVAANPGLGIRISAEHVANELRSMDARTFAVERLGVGDWPSLEGMDESPIPVVDWNDLLDAGSEITDPFVLAVDMSPDRNTTIAAASRRPDGLYHVEVVYQAKGARWLPDKLAGMVEKNPPHEVVCCAHGPIASQIDKIESAGITMRTFSVQEHAQACGQLVDLVDERQVRHLGSHELSNALRGARTRPLGDAWAWSRKNSTVDISPLVAATLALSAAQQLPEDDTPVIY